WDALLERAGRPLWRRSESNVLEPLPRMQGLSIAVAYDDAFCDYFADTLELLEQCGAELLDFSPLSDAEIPAAADIVYLGGGRLERTADQLAANSCMIASLRRFAERGGRVYAEAAGMAYLSERLQLPSGQVLPMAGVLPTAAVWRPVAAPPASPTGVSLPLESWLGGRGDTLRGYACPNWKFETVGPVDAAVGDGAGGAAFVQRRHVIGSQLCLNLVAQPHLLRHFLTRPLARTAR
ncbi:MAG: hypothetical protein KDA41_17145, partial [Planctomycetales bacterium]|nr:hypothetical protein [Planctomycetales bacterium]